MNQDYFHVSSPVNKIKHLLYWPLLLIRGFFFPLAKIPFVIIILLVGFYALYLNDQGQDMMASFTAKSILRNSYLALFQIFLVAWAVSIWNVARILLTAANFQQSIQSQVTEQELINENINDVIKSKDWVVASIDPNYKNVLSFMIRWVPRFLALFPYFIYLLAYYQQSPAFSGRHPENYITIFIIIALHLLFMLFRKRIGKHIYHIPVPYYPSKEAYSIEQEKSTYLVFVKARIIISSIFTLLMTFIMFLYALWAAYLTPSGDGKPGLILLTAFTVYTLVGLLLNLMVNRFRIPVFMMLVLFAIIVALKSNDNHTVQTIRSAQDDKILSLRNSLTDSAYADYWIAKKQADGILDPAKAQNIFIIAAEGGGIRNAYWTYRVLYELQKLDSNFYKKTFAATGVSGGSIGLGFYYNYRFYCDERIQSGRDTAHFNDKLDTICSSDYLSRVTFGLMFPDLLQRFIPARIDSWDRSKMLANSFDDGFSERVNDPGEHFLSNNYLNMWANPATAYQRPVLLFNTIFNEDGIKALYAPYRLSDSYYANAMDLLFETNRSVPMKEAMTSSARFPLLTAPGLIWRDCDPLNQKDNCKDSVKLGHISDGGGFENTGIQTAVQTALLLYNRLEANKFPDTKVRILYIGTGANDIQIADLIPGNVKSHKKAIGRYYELAWFKGALKALFGWISDSHNIVSRIKPDLKVLKFGLDIRSDSQTHKLPLGWYLSDTSRKILAKQANAQFANELYKKSTASFKAFAKATDQ